MISLLEHTEQASRPLNRRTSENEEKFYLRFEKYRRMQNASNMEKLKWDWDLADAAQEYVESCECLELCHHGFAFNTR